MKSLPIFRSTAAPTAAATATEKALHQIWENSRRWHLAEQNSRPEEHGHMLRALLVAAATHAGVFDALQSHGDAEIQALIAAAEKGSDDASHAGVHMTHARALLYIVQHDRDAAKFLARNLAVLQDIAQASEAFYQSDADFFADLRPAERAALASGSACSECQHSPL